MLQCTKGHYVQSFTTLGNYTPCGPVLAPLHVGYVSIGKVLNLSVLRIICKLRRIMIPTTQRRVKGLQ